MDSANVCKETIGITYYKILGDGAKNHDFQYEIGLNIDDKPFNRTFVLSIYRARPVYGMHFAKLEDISNYFHIGPLIAEIEIPRDAYVVCGNKMLKADRIIIKKIMPIINWLKEPLVHKPSEFYAHAIIHNFITDLNEVPIYHRTSYVYDAAIWKGLIKNLDEVPINKRDSNVYVQAIRCGLINNINEIPMDIRTRDVYREAIHCDLFNSIDEIPVHDRTYDLCRCWNIRQENKQRISSARGECY